MNIKLTLADWTERDEKLFQRQKRIQLRKMREKASLEQMEFPFDLVRIDPFDLFTKGI